MFADVDKSRVNKRYNELLASDAAAVLPICLTIERANEFSGRCKAKCEKAKVKKCATVLPFEVAT